MTTASYIGRCIGTFIEAIAVGVLVHMKSWDWAAFCFALSVLGELSLIRLWVSGKWRNS